MQFSSPSYNYVIELSDNYITLLLEGGTSSSDITVTVELPLSVEGE